MKSIKKRVKHTIKAVFSKIKSQRQYNRYIKKIRNQLNMEKSGLPQLAKAQEDAIQAFWANYHVKPDLEWFRLFYAKTGNETPEYVTDPIFHQKIKIAMNEPAFANVWGDKAYIDHFVKGVKTVECVVRNVNGRFLNNQFELIDQKQAQEIMDRYEALVIKPSTNTHTGIGVELIHAPFDLGKLTNEYKKNFVIQVPLRQHPDMGKLNASSINTMRINSVLFETEAHVMSAFVKVGQAGEFADNHGKDRYFIGIREDGTYMDYAIDHNLKKHSTIPSGFAFAGQPVPFFDRVCAAVEKAHKCIPHFGFAYWDICVNESGEPVIVEINLRNPDTNIAQVTGNPFLGKYTEQIMEYISK